VWIYDVINGFFFPANARFRLSRRLDRSVDVSKSY